MIDKLGSGHYETLDGWPVVILCLDAPGNRPVVGYVVMCDGASVAHSWLADGKCSLGSRRVTEMDLRPAKRQPREVWIDPRNLEYLDEEGNRVVGTKPLSSSAIRFREVMESE